MSPPLRKTIGPARSGPSAKAAAAQIEHQMRRPNAKNATGNLRGDVERGISPRQFAANSKRCADNGIEMRAGQRAENQDQDRKDRAGRRWCCTSSASATFPPASRCAMIPEPTTAASSSRRAKRLRSRRGVTDRRSLCLRLGGGTLAAANLPQPVLQCQSIQRGDRQRGEHDRYAGSASGRHPRMPVRFEPPCRWLRQDRECPNAPSSACPARPDRLRPRRCRRP